MKTKLLIYSLPVLLFAMMLLYGYRIQDHPTNIDQSSTKEYLQANQDNIPVTPAPAGVCTYSWAAQTSGTTSQLLTVSAVSELVGWAAGGGTTPTVIRTINGGTWTPATGTGITGGVFNIYAINDQIAFCTTTPATTTFIYKTVNGGVLWTQVFSQAGGFIDAIHMISPTEGYAVGDPVGGTWTILKTVNGGDTWARMATEPAQVGTEAGWNNSFLIIGTHIWFGTNNTRVYHSPDLGATWSFAATTGTLSTFALHFNDLLNGLAGGTAMVKSIDGGASYSGTLSPGTVGNIDGLEGIYTDWWAIRSDANVYKSADQGATPWTIVHTQATAVFQDIDFALDSGCAAGWAVGNGGNIAKMTAVGPLPVELSSFTSSAISNNVTLNWTTASENNNSGFEIERSMVNNEWSKIGFVEGSGTTTTPKNYSFTDRNLNSGNYNYRLKQIDYNGNFEYYNLSNEVVIGIPENFSLGQNYPNPFNPSTKIDFQLPNDGNVSISVFDNSGKEIMILVNEFKTAGYYTVNLNATSLSSGVYFYKISSDNLSIVKKMMLVK